MCDVASIITKEWKAGKGEDTAADSIPLCFCVTDCSFKTFFPSKNPMLFIAALLEKPLCPEEWRSRVEEVAMGVYIL